MLDKCGSYQALKAAVHTYPLIVSDQWESISRSIMGTIAYAYGQDSLGEPSNSFSSQQTFRKGVAPLGSALSGQTARLADDKVVHSAVKVNKYYLACPALTFGDVFQSFQTISCEEFASFNLPVEDMSWTFLTCLISYDSCLMSFLEQLVDIKGQMIPLRRDYYSHQHHF